jgi:hypothetical protein
MILNISISLSKSSKSSPITAFKNFPAVDFGTYILGVACSIESSYRCIHEGNLPNTFFVERESTGLEGSDIATSIIRRKLKDVNTSNSVFTTTSNFAYRFTSFDRSIDPRALDVVVTANSHGPIFAI